MSLRRKANFDGLRLDGKPDPPPTSPYDPLNPDSTPEPLPLPGEPQPPAPVREPYTPLPVGDPKPGDPPRVA